MKKLLLGSLLVFSSILSYGQFISIPVGNWRVHVPYNQAKFIAQANDLFYVATTDGLFFYNRSELYLGEITKFDGLSDVGISYMDYNPWGAALVICYENGNIDLIRDNTIININDIERKTILGSKKINHVNFDQHIAYLSTDFGLVVLDLQKEEVKETYSNIGPGGSVVEVYSSAINDTTETIYLATENGVMSASAAPGVNLLDFNNWYTHTMAADSIPENNVVYTAVTYDTVYVAVESDAVYYLHDTLWRKTAIDLTGEGVVRSMKRTFANILLCTQSEVHFFNRTYKDSTINATLISSPYQALLDENNRFFLADAVNGLVKNDEGPMISSFPNGPGSREVFRMFNHDNEIIACAGGYSLSNYSPNFWDKGFYFYNDEKWHTRNRWFPGSPGFQDVLDAIYNPADGKYYFGSYSHGVMTWESQTDIWGVFNDTSYVLIGVDTSRPTLEPLFPGVMRVTDLELEENGNIWVAQRVVNNGDPSLHVLRTSGYWKAFTFSQPDALAPREMVIDDFGTKWIRLGGTGGLNGLFAFNENDMDNDFDDQSKYLTVANGLPTSDVKSIAKDKNNEIWVGTTAGVAVFFDPGKVFTSSSFTASTPIFEFRPLLKDEVINTIKVDGGNRKWIGTDNGAWLFNDNGTREIVHFNTENSPLPSNVILDIEISGITGEVFIATDKGLVSYRGTATETGDTHADTVRIFPNPVHPDYEGIVGITGLAFDATVKITDISGKLIYQMDSNGGMAVWDRRGLNGEVAKTGVYLVYSSTKDGVDSFVGKLAIIE